MPNSNHMSTAAHAKAPVATVDRLRGYSGRLSYKTSVPVADLRKAVEKVVHARLAREQAEAAAASNANAK